jgi:hypothetical protein
MFNDGYPVFKELPTHRSLMTTSSICRTPQFALCSTVDSVTFVMFRFARLRTIQKPLLRLT